jgi:lipopolysaccharide assembly protein A
MAVLRFLSSLGWLAVFAVLVVFAIKNTEPATLHFYFDRTWQAPLVFIMALSFVAGAAFGVIACIAPIARQRREIARLEKELRLREPAPVAGEPPRPATVPDVPSAP